MSPDKSLVIPLFKNEENISELIDVLVSLDERVPGDLEVIFVDDGSPDHSVQRIEERLQGVSLDFQIVRHSRNFGSFAAITSGLRSARGESIAVMAADLQEPPELIEEFFAVLATGEADIVVGARRGRQDGRISSTLSNLFWSAYRTFVQPEIPPGGVDVFGCSRQVSEVIHRLPESNSSLVGLLYWVGFRRVEVSYDRLPRSRGESAWNFRRRMKYLNDSIFSFTTLPINLILFVGALGTLVALALSIFVFIAWLRGLIPEPGFTSLALIQLGSTASILLALGVVGTYVWRTFDNSKGRPNAIIRK